MLRIFLFIAFVLHIYGLKVCVVGGSSSLGREIIYQGLNDFNYNMIGVTESPDKVCVPYRGKGLNEKAVKQRIIDKRLMLIHYSQAPQSYDAVIFTIGGSAFEKSDYSDKITKTYLESLPNQCKTIILISAYGVGNSIQNANLGIVSMRNWYLKDVYRAKEKQEELVNSFDRKGVKKLIYRPKVLSYGNTSFDSTPRQKLARLILEQI